MAILDDVSAHLQTLNLGQPIYSAGFPATGPDDATALFEYVGAPPLMTKGTKTPALRRTRFQVVCRSKAYKTARDKAETILGTLSGLSGQMGATRYASVRALGEPFPLGVDGSSRQRIAVNYEATKN